MKYPLLIIKIGEAPLYVFEEGELGLISKGGEKFYSKGKLYDSEGKVFEIKGASKIKRASFFKSIKFFQQMYFAQINFNEIEKVSLDSLKKIIKEHILEYEKYWENKDEINSLLNIVEEKQSFQSLIKFLK